MGDMRMALDVYKKMGNLNKNFIDILPYVNGREKGIMLLNTKINRIVVFSENRNSDNLIVYSELVKDVWDIYCNRPDGFPLSESAYTKRIYRRADTTQEKKESAKFIKELLMKL